jgi:hypothetical protein
METADRALWTASVLSDEFDVSANTARGKVRDLVSRGKVRAEDLGKYTAYYLPQSLEHDTVDTETRHTHDLVDHFTDRFVGLETAPWTAIHPSDGATKPGDRIQLRVVGRPGEWSVFGRAHWSGRKEALEEGNKADFETQALISGTLVARPTVPIEHLDYADDYELEQKTGVRWVKRDDGTPASLVADGPQNYLLDPCDDAAFLTDVSVTDISPEGEGYDAEIVGEGDSPDGVSEAVEQWREENLTEDREPGL